MARHGSKLPQLGSDLFLCDAGLETDLIFNRGIDIPEFAAHTLLPDGNASQELTQYFRRFLELAETCGAGFILDAPTWKAHSHWAKDLGSSTEDLRAANHEAVAFVRTLRDNSSNSMPVLLNGITSPCGDAYEPENLLSVGESEDYHRQQLEWLAEAGVDMVSAMTFTQSGEAAGYARAARELNLHHAISFTLETDGALPSGEALSDAVNRVDDESDHSTAYFMINCAHPDHFKHVFNDSGEWTHRIRGLRCNASRQSHAELDACDVLDDGNPDELGEQYAELLNKFPWMNIFGGCCGSDIRHVRSIAAAVRESRSVV